MSSANRQAVTTPQASKMRTILIFITAAMVGIPPMIIGQGTSVTLTALMTKYDAMPLYSMVLIVYNLGRCISMPVAGKLSDIFGRRMVSMISLAGYAAMLIVGSFAPNATVFMVCYGVVGLCYGAMSGLTMAIISDGTTPQERPRYFGYYFTLMNICTLVGPLLAGLVTDLIGANYFFLGVAPLVVISFFLSWKFCPNTRSNKAVKIDYAGILLLALAIVPLILVLNWAGSLFPWSSVQAIGGLAFSLVMWIVFFKVENKAEGPIISPKFFKNPIFTAGITINVLGLFCFTYFGAYLQLFAQGLWGLSATVAATLTTPRAILGILAPTIVVLFATKKQNNTKIVFVVYGLMLAAAALGVMSVTVETSLYVIYAYVLLSGCVICIGPTMNAYVSSGFDKSEIGSGFAISTLATAIGGTLATAVFGGILNAGWSPTKYIDPALSEILNADQMKSLSSSQVLRNAKAFQDIKDAIPADMHALVDTTREAMVTAMTQIKANMGYIVIGLALVMVVVALFAKMPAVAEKANETDSPKREEK